MKQLEIPSSHGNARCVLINNIYHLICLCRGQLALYRIEYDGLLLVQSLEIKSREYHTLRLLKKGEKIILCVSNFHNYFVNENGFIKTETYFKKYKIIYDELYLDGNTHAIWQCNDVMEFAVKTFLNEFQYNSIKKLNNNIITFNKQTRKLSTFAIGELFKQILTINDTCLVMSWKFIYIIDLD